MRKIVCAILVMMLSFSVTQAQKKDLKEKIYLKLKDGAKPTIYVDGKKFDFPIALIDQTQIESVFVIKGKEAKQKYNAPNGVILVKTIGAKNSEKIYSKVSEDTKVFSGKKSPMVIIDGKIVDEETFKKYDTKNIESIEVVKGEKAIKKYNAPNGVIIIKTKKK